MFCVLVQAIVQSGNSSIKDFQFPATVLCAVTGGGNSGANGSVLCAHVPITVPQLPGVSAQDTEHGGIALVTINQTGQLGGGADPGGKQLHGGVVQLVRACGIMLLQMGGEPLPQFCNLFVVAGNHILVRRPAVALCKLQLTLCNGVLSLCNCLIAAGLLHVGSGLFQLCRCLVNLALQGGVGVPALGENVVQRIDKIGGGFGGVHRLIFLSFDFGDDSLQNSLCFRCGIRVSFGSFRVSCPFLHLFQTGMHKANSISLAAVLPVGGGIYRDSHNGIFHGLCLLRLCGVKGWRGFGFYSVCCGQTRSSYSPHCGGASGSARSRHGWGFLVVRSLFDC